MDTLKEKLPVIGIGVAAIAIAGYIAFGWDKGGKKEKKEDASAEVPTQAAEAVEAAKEPEERIEGEVEFFFIDESMSQAEKEKAIEEWVLKQIKFLMMEGDLKAPDGCLNKDDFLWLCHILENKLNCQKFDEKKRLQSSRIQLINDKGFDHVDYIKQVNADVEHLNELNDKPKLDLLKQAAVSI